MVWRCGLVGEQGRGEPETGDLTFQRTNLFQDGTKTSNAEPIGSVEGSPSPLPSPRGEGELTSGFPTHLCFEVRMGEVTSRGLAVRRPSHLPTVMSALLGWRSRM